MVGVDGVLLTGTAPLAQPIAPPVVEPPASKPPATATGGWLVPGVVPELSSAQLDNIQQSLEVSLARSLAEVREKPVVRRR